MAIRCFKPDNLRSHGARITGFRATGSPGECGQSRSVRTFRTWYSSSRMRRQIVNGLGMAPPPVRAIFEPPVQMSCAASATPTSEVPIPAARMAAGRLRNVRAASTPVACKAEVLARKPIA